MANRAYLYSANETMTKLRDVSESRYPIPLFYKILLGEDTSMCDSKIWGYEHPIAIKGDFQKGLNKLYTFYDYLATQSAINTTEIAKYKAETKAFFEKEPGRINQYFFLEAGEIFDLIGDSEPIEQQNEALYEEIRAISTEINAILESKPADIFAFSQSFWLKELKKNVELLSVYWTYVTYFSFNKSE